MPESRKPRPIGVIYLSIFLSLLAIWNGVRLSETFFFWNTLKAYGAYPLYISISGGAWFIIGLVLIWGLWQGKCWGRVTVICGSAVYTSWYWFDRLVLQKPHSNWLFVLIMNITIMFFVLGILFSKGTRQFFKRVGHERQSENPTTS